MALSVSADEFDKSRQTVPGAQRHSADEEALLRAAQRIRSIETFAGLTPAETRPDAATCGVRNCSKPKGDGRHWCDDHAAAIDALVTLSSRHYLEP